MLQSNAKAHANRLRAAIIGCGQIAGGYDEENRQPNAIRTHAKAYSIHPGTKLIAVADTNGERAKKFAQRWMVPAAYTDARLMLSEAKPDLVSICTPDENHAEWLEACLLHPVRAVWCEKPIVTDEKLGEDLVARYEERGVPLAVNYLRRWDKALQRIGETVRADAGARVKAIVTYGKGLRHSGSHAIDLLLDWLGPVTRFKVLSCLTDYVATDPTVTAWLEFANGAEVHLIGCDDRRYTLWEIDLFGPAWRFRITQTGLQVESYALRADFIDSGSKALDAVPAVCTTDLSRAVYSALENIVARVREGQALRSTGRTALEALKVCNNIIREAQRRS